MDTAGIKKLKQGSPQWYLSLGIMPFSLIFLKPNLESLDFFDLMWIVGIADFVLKYLTIALKCLIVALPKIILAVKSKVRVSCPLDNFIPLQHVCNMKYGWKNINKNLKISAETLAESHQFEPSQT